MKAARRFTRSLSFYGAAIGFALATIALPHTVAAYHFIYETSGTTKVPVSWGTLPLSFTLDVNGGQGTNFRTDAQTAFNAWNNVTTARDMFGASTNSAVDFTGANYQTAWGAMPADGDGNYEIVCDTDRTALQAAGIANPLVRGLAQRQHKVVGGQGRIVDGFFILDCQSAVGGGFNHVGTMVHEFGHVLGLRHSSAYLPVGQNFDAYEGQNVRLKPLALADAPTMYPYVFAGNETLAPDDIAGISHLYPETNFATLYGTITGTVTRCETGEAVSGVNVRAVSTTDAKVQITRYTGFDGNTTGAYEIKVPVGSYNVIIEVMTLPVASMAMLTAPATDFTTEYRSNATEESDCSEELPDSETTVSVGAGDEGLDVIGAMVTSGIDFKTNPVELAFVIDDTGSMGNEIGAVRTILTNEVTQLAASGKPFPNTAIITFKDSVMIRKISRSPTVLQGIISGLTASGGGDCPEFSNDALLAAGRLLRRAGKSVLFTDADSHSTGATAGAVSSLYASKSLRMSVLLSGVCSGDFDRSTNANGGGGPRLDPARSRNDAAVAGDFLPPEPTLGTQTAVETNAAIVAATGGMMAVIPGIKYEYSGGTETTRYVNTGTNIAVSAAGLATIGLVNPGDGPRGTTIDIEINGSNTNFQGSTVVTISGSGVTVNSRTVRSATSIVANVTIDPTATISFRDITATTSLGGGVTETATGVGAFRVASAPSGATIVSVSPSSGGLGQTRTITIFGANTSFSSASVPIFCASYSCYYTSDHDPKIVVNSVTALNSTTLQVNLTVASDATVAYRDVAVITGTQVATESVTGPFLVSPPALAIPLISSVSPTSGIRGQTLTLSIAGETTNFVSGSSVVSFSGTGITVNTTTVSSSTSATANITIAAGATLGFRDVFVTTGGETAALINGFNVTDPPTAEAATGLYAASIVGNQVTLRWTPPATGLVPTGYVLEGGLNTGEILASLPTGSTNPIFTFTAPTGAFYVRLHTMAGAIRSAASNEIRIFVNLPAVAPSTPTNFAGMVTGSSLAFAWQNTFAGGPPASLVLDVTGSRTASLPLALGESATFAGAPSGTYTFRLRSLNAAGASVASSPITLSVPTSCTGVPSVPTDFLAYRVGNTIYVVWNPPNGGAAATGYSLVVTGAFNLSVPTTARSMFGTVPAGTYNLSVRGTNACGSGAATSVQTIVIP